jgi:hypothetical protein
MTGKQKFELPTPKKWQVKFISFHLLTTTTILNYVKAGNMDYSWR